MVAVQADRKGRGHAGRSDRRGGRTPVGKRNGGLSGVHPVDLSAHVLRSLAERPGVDPALVDDVIWGCVGQVGEQTFDIARNAVLAAGWPESVPGVTIDRQCGSSQQSVHFAAAGLIAGQYDVVVAGGVESMSGCRWADVAPAAASRTARPDLDRYGGVFPNQGVGAEMMAAQWGLSPHAARRVRLASHEKAAAAQDAGVSRPRSHRCRSLTAAVEPSTRASAGAARGRRWAR